MKTIIHITGASGAGKTTIGLQLSKLGLYVIDTDDINDKNALVKTHNYLTTVRSTHATPSSVFVRQFC